MKQNLTKIALFALATASAALFSCSKSSQSANISQPLTVIGQAISDTILPQKDNNGNAIPLKGTMLAGKVYHIYADVTINAGDTVYVQPGVTVYVHGNGAVGSSPTILVNGAFISDGTKDNQNVFTSYPTTATPNSDNTLEDNVTTDPAYRGYWDGFQGGPTCTLMTFRWTHVQYVGGPYGVNATAFGAASTDPAPGIYMNPSASGPYGKFIFEDSWLFGSFDDCIGKCQHVYVSIMRNTLSKLGGNGGEGVNLKNDVYGDMAYNFCYGVATNGLKTAGITTSSTIVNIYNNTVVNCGYRQTKATRNGSINTETNAGGYIYNNIIVNCKQGLRISYVSQKGMKSDTLNTMYGNNLTYVGTARTDPSSVDNYLMLYIEPRQFTIKQPTDFNGYVNGPDSTDGQNLGHNGVPDSTMYNPKFTNYDVIANAKGTSYRYSVIPSGADFHLTSGSQAIGTGVYPGGTGINAMPSKPSAPLLTQYGFPMHVLTGPAGGVATANVTPPNKDMGAFPTDGSGNQHRY